MLRSYFGRCSFQHSRYCRYRYPDSFVDEKMERALRITTGR